MSYLNLTLLAFIKKIFVENYF